MIYFERSGCDEMFYDIITKEKLRILKFPLYIQEVIILLEKVRWRLT